jgi:hypothetical protein
MTLNGWQRLWVLLCSLWLITVLVGGFLTFPSPAIVRYMEAFERLTAESRMKLIAPNLEFVSGSWLPKFAAPVDRRKYLRQGGSGTSVEYRSNELLDG